MGAAFGHDFSRIRIFADEAAAASAQEMGAKAYTVGPNIVFNERFYDPHGAAGRTLLAHELAHVVQQDRAGGSAGPGALSEPGDAAEREAEAVAEQAASGEPVEVRAAPTARASRGLLDWVEEKASDVGSAVSDTASAAWDGTKTAASDIYGGMKTAGGWIKSGEEAVGHGIDWVEDKEKAATGWLASKAEGIPVLEQVANAGKSMVDMQTEFTGGALRGATGLVGGVAGMIANPVDTARGLEAMAEHIPGPLGTGLKGAHGLLNVATGDETWDQFGKSMDPVESLKQDGQFWKTVGGGFIGQYGEQWNQGKYADVAGRAAFDIGSLFVGAGEANAAAKVGEASKLADAARLGKAARLGETAKLGEAAKLGEVADLGKLGDAAKLGEASDASKISEAATVSDAEKVVHPGKLAAESQEVSRESVMRALRQSDSVEGAATAKLIKRNQVKLDIRDAVDPKVNISPEAGGYYAHGSDTVSVIKPNAGKPGQAAGLTGHEVRHWLQNQAKQAYTKDSELEAYQWSKSIDKTFPHRTDEEIQKFIDASPLYKNTRRGSW